MKRTDYKDQVNNEDNGRKKVIYEQKKYFMHYRGYIYVILEVILKVKNLPKAT